jgi:hypothetical protein
MGMDRLHTELDFRLQHLHGDGSWGTFQRREPRSPAETDPERGWRNGHIYACTTCDEKVIVAPVDEEPPVD